MAEQRLTLKQERFINAYLGDARGNATEAARRAGYAEPMQQGYRLLRNVEVRARIDEYLREQTLSSAEVLAELTEVARADWKDFIQIRYSRTGVMLDAKIVLADKVKALELLGKYYKLFTDKTEITGANGGPVRVVDLTRLTDEELRALETLDEKLSLTAGDPGGEGEA